MRQSPRNGFLSALLLLALAATSDSRADTAGVAAHQPTPKDPNGMSAGTFFKLLDASLGNKFNSLVLVFGGCFTAAFTKAVQTSVVGTSGKPVATLAATSATNAGEYNGGGTNGNTFTRGVTDGLSGDTATAQDGFDSGKAKAKRAAKDDDRTQDPTFTPLGGGAGIRVGVNAASFHAILFMGHPESVQDWMDLQTQYDELRAKGYPAANIDCYFGRGERAPAPDGTPILSMPNFSAGKSLQQIHDADPSKNDFRDSGQPIKAATEKALEDALKALKALADADANEQYFLWFADHSVFNATAMVTSRDCTGTALCSVGVDLDQTFLQFPYEDPPAVLLQPLGIVGSNHIVSLNGVALGAVDPALYDELQRFPATRGQLSLGTNVVNVTNNGSSFLLNDVTITTGTVPLLSISKYIAEPRPFLGPWLQALLAAVLIVLAAWSLRRLP